MATRFEKRYCDDCMSTHWVEVSQSYPHKETCHGENYVPKDDANHYTRWRAGGIELVEKAYTPAEQMPLEWQLTEQREEYIQDW